MKDIIQTSWYLKYNPKNIDDLIFDNENHKQLILNFIKNEKIDGNLLLFGSYGLGKSATAGILINTIIKTQNDLLVLKERSVNEIREKVLPFIQKKPIKSNQKIVLIEEMDKLSKDAFNVLKTNTLEKFQVNTSFIGCTNYIKKIEPAVVSRFNTKIEFNGLNIDGIYERLKYILKQEEAKFNENELLDFVKENYTIGIRELINQLQLSYNSNNKSINFETISLTGGIENQIVSLIMTILGIAIKANLKDKKIILDFPENSIIKTQYKELIQLLNNNTDINFDYIFNQLYSNVNYIPIKLIIAKEANINQNKIFPHVSLLSCYYEMIKCIITINRI